ncbi:hypothetical protein IH970_02795 [candidate division KSB1 bacterium]|nr:hypothetical protein [candidate division KSB1 bacterium]
MEWIYIITVLASSIAAILAWIAKLLWSKEYIAAKDEVIKAKDAQIEVLNQQIEGLKELTPMKIREYFLSVKLQLEEYNDHLKGQLKDSKKKLSASQYSEKKLSAEKLKAIRGRMERNRKLLERVKKYPKVTESDTILSVVQRTFDFLLKNNAIDKWVSIHKIEEHFKDKPTSRGYVEQALHSLVASNLIHDELINGVQHFKIGPNPDN